MQLEFLVPIFYEVGHKVTIRTFPYLLDQPILTDPV